MKLADYEKQIDEIMTSHKLTPQEKRAALELTAKEIRGCAWNGNVKQYARTVASMADMNAVKYPDGGLAALDSLAAKGFLERI